MNSDVFVLVWLAYTFQTVQCSRPLGGGHWAKVSDVSAKAIVLLTHGLLSIAAMHCFLSSNATLH